MKKRLFSIFLAALMLLTLLPVTALAEETHYMVSVCGTEVTSANKGNVLGDGTVSYTPATEKTPARLTLANAALEGDNGEALIDASEELEIVLVGANTLIQTATNTDTIEIRGDLTISGDGSLVADNSISAWEKLTVGGSATVTVNKKMIDDEYSWLSNDALTAQTISIGGSSTINVTADGAYAIQAENGIQISENANVTVESINESKGAVRVSAGDIAITTGGKVEIKATCTDIEYEDWGSSAISAQNITFGGSGNVKISADGGRVIGVCGKTNDYGEYADGGNVTFAGSGTVTITQEDSDSHALYALGDVIANGSGKVSVSTAGTGAAVYAKNVNIGGSGTFEASAVEGNAILAYGSYEKVTDKYLGGGDVTVSGSACVKAINTTGNDCAVYAAGAVTLTTAGEVCASARNEDEGYYSSAIYARNVTVGGKGTVTADGDIYAWVGSLTVGDSAGVTAASLGANQGIIITTGGNVVSGEIYAGEGGVTISGSGMLTAKNGINAWGGDITLGGSGKVIAEGSIETSSGNIVIGGSADVVATAQDNDSWCISAPNVTISDRANVTAVATATCIASPNITISTSGTVKLESTGEPALSCSELKVESTAGKLLLYGKGEAMKVRIDLDLAAGLVFYGSAKQNAGENEMTKRATWKAVQTSDDFIGLLTHAMVVGNDTAQSLVLRRTPVASILQLLSNTVATINQVSKVTRTAALLALPAVFIVNRMLTRLFR